MKLNKLVIPFALALSISAAAVAADPVPTIEDGRVNEWDIAAPAAIYCTFEYPDAADLDKTVLDDIEVWALTSAGNSHKVIEVTAEDIAAAGVTGEDLVLASSDGYTLNRASNGQLYVTGPANDKGVPYLFVWDLGDINC